MAWNLGLLGASGQVIFTSGFELLQSETLSGSVGEVTFSNLNTYAADYQHLQLRMRQYPNGQNQQSLYLRFNGSTSPYVGHGFGANDATTVYQYGFQESGLKPGYYSPVYGDSDMHAIFDILDFGSTTKNTTARGHRMNWIKSANGEGSVEHTTGAWFNAAQVTSMTLSASSGVIGFPATFSLYGYKKVV